jgi:hypothetical protein
MRINGSNEDLTNYCFPPVFDLLSFISFSLDTALEHFFDFLYIRSNSKYLIVNYKQDNHWYNI